jgi:hypothetical protein
MKFQLAIVLFTIASTYSAANAQPLNATFRGTVIYPSDILPPQKVCAENIRSKQIFCTETKQGGKEFSLSVVPGTYQIYALECQKLYRQSIACRDGYRSQRAYYNQHVICGLTYQCGQKFPKPQPLNVKIAAGQTISKIQPHDWYSRPSK